MITLKKATENLLAGMLRAANRERSMLQKLLIADNIATVRDAAMHDTVKLREILISYGYNIERA